MVTGTMIQIVDGDTFVINVLDVEETVRIIGVDTHETNSSSPQLKYLGEKASKFVKELIPPGTEVELSYDVEERDPFNRLLAYVHFNGEMVNQRLLEEGLAYVTIYYPNEAHKEEFIEAQNQAMENQVGMWSNQVGSTDSTVMTDMIKDSPISRIPQKDRASSNPQSFPNYQEFPAEYFSGADVAIYMSDTSRRSKWVEEITSINFRIFEQVRPVFGYNSFTFDQLVRGNRMVQGQFRIPLRKPGYLEELLQMHESGKPPVRNDENVRAKREIVNDYPELQVGAEGHYVKILQHQLIKQGFSAYSTIQQSNFPTETRPVIVGVDDWLYSYAYFINGENRSGIPLHPSMFLNSPEPKKQEILENTVRRLYDMISLDYYPANRSHVTPELFLRISYGLVDANGELHPKSENTFDFFTLLAVTQFQDNYGLEPNGVVEEEFWKRLVDFQWVERLGESQQDSIQRSVQKRYENSFFKTPFVIRFNYGNRQWDENERPMIRTLTDIYLFAKTHWVGYEQGRVADDIYEFIAKDMMPENGKDYKALHPTMNIN